MAPLHACITLFADSPIGKVNRRVFGNNMLGYQKGSWPHAEPTSHNCGAGIREPERRRPLSDMVALAKDIGLSVAHYPGNCGIPLFGSLEFLQYGIPGRSCGQEMGGGSRGTCSGSNAATRPNMASTSRVVCHPPNTPKITCAIVAR